MICKMIDKIEKIIFIVINLLRKWRWFENCDFARSTPNSSELSLLIPLKSSLQTKIPDQNQCRKRDLKLHSKGDSFNIPMDWLHAWTYWIHVTCLQLDLGDSQVKSTFGSQSEHEKNQNNFFSWMHVLCFNFCHAYFVYIEVTHLSTRTLFYGSNFNSFSQKTSFRILWTSAIYNCDEESSIFLGIMNWSWHCLIRNLSFCWKHKQFEITDIRNMRQMKIVLWPLNRNNLLGSFTSYTKSTLVSPVKIFANFLGNIAEIDDSRKFIPANIVFKNCGGW